MIEISKIGGAYMAAYFLAEITIHHPKKMGPYLEKVESTIAEHEGVYLARGGKVEVVEGNIGEHPLKVLLQFPTMEKLKGWYYSAEYQEIIGNRLENADGNTMFMDGV
jgi:uncharacterized protein (DUF1330 family)